MGLNPPRQQRPGQDRQRRPRPEPSGLPASTPSRVAAPGLRTAWTLSAGVSGVAALVGAALVAEGLVSHSHHPDGFGLFDVYTGVLLLLVFLSVTVLVLVALRLASRRGLLAHLLAVVGLVPAALLGCTSTIELAQTSGPRGPGSLLALVLLVAATLWFLVVLVWSLLGAVRPTPRGDAAGTRVP